LAVHWLSAVRLVFFRFSVSGCSHSDSSSFHTTLTAFAVGVAEVKFTFGANGSNENQVIIILSKYYLIKIITMPKIIEYIMIYPFKFYLLSSPGVS